MASDEGLRSVIDHINAIMCEMSTNCLRLEIPYPTLYLNSSLFQKAGKGPGDEAFIL